MRTVGFRRQREERPGLEHGRAVRQDRRARAFTLVEILIAVAVFSIVLAAINAIFYGALRLRNKTVEAIDEALPLRQAIPILKRDLASLVVPGGILSGPLQTTPERYALPGQVSPNFYSASAMIDDSSPFGDVQQIAYLLAEPTNRLAAGKDLVRAVTRNLLSSVPEQPVQQWLLPGVQHIQFLFFDGRQWLGAWDTTVQTNLPQAIKVEIQLTSQSSGRSRSLPAPVEFVVPVDVQGRSNRVQQAAAGDTP